MKLHLNLSLRRALMAAMAAVCTLSSTAYSGVVDGRYDLQYYLDFCRNKGMFATGATNIEVFFKDGTSVTNNTIPLMPNMDSYGETAASIYGDKLMGSNGGTNLVSSQFVYGAKHVHAKVGNTPVAFLSENGSAACTYTSANLDNFGTDSAIQRLTKLVTSVVYTPMADDDFMRSSLFLNSSWLYRLGNGGYWSDGKSISTGDNSLGGVVNLSVKWQDTNTGEWYLEGWARKNDLPDDTLTPLEIGTYFGDSGSPIFAWDDKNNRFLFVGAQWAGGCQRPFPNWYLLRYNYQQGTAVMDKYTVAASFSGTDTILWSASDAASGKGTLTQGADTSVDYTGKGTANSLGDSLGLTFSTEDTTNVQNLQLQGNVNMGAGALTFENGKWRITETEGNNFSLSSAGLDISNGAEVTWELTGVSGQEIRKVGEGILTVAGSGNNAASLVVGGGTTVYNVVRDENGNITGCTLGNAGETRLNRTDGYAASSVRLEGGVAILVLMADNQFRTNSVAGDTFSFGNDGGLLNLNGHDLSWGVINQDGSGSGARIGNFTPKGEKTPGLATFTYTGTGTFAGSFMDEGADGAQLAVKYNREGGTWKLTGQSNNAGGYTVEAGTMVLEGSLTPHVRSSDANDWTYAGIETSEVAVKSGATFQLSHHALMKGNVTVESGGSFILNQTVNAASESISGSLRKDMASLGITSLIGNVTLNGTASMTVNTNSPVTTTMKGNITGDTSGNSFASFTKTGSGNFVVNGQMAIPRGTVEQGGLIVTDAANFLSTWSMWTIKEEGFLAVQGIDGQKLASCIHESSSGVLALTTNQTKALDLSLSPNLYIGAYGETPIEYGTSDVTLSANSDGNWLLGGGTGTLNVNFKLTGAGNLIIGNEYSSGTVHLTNTANDFTGDIYIKGSGNMLTYVNGALGSARVALSYGNTLALNDVNQLAILKDGAEGALALSQSLDIDLSGEKVALAANGALTYTGKLTVDDMYRFGGKGDLTLDTDLSSAGEMELDGQGNTGSSVTFAQKNAYAGDIVAGGGLHLADTNSAGTIDIHVGHAEALASASSVELQKGATLHMDGRDSLVVNNLSALAGSSIQNKGETATLLQLHVDENVSTTIADGVLLNANNNAALSLVKTGKGTVTMGANATWNGGLTIAEGIVAASLSSDGTFNSAGGIGAASNTIYVDKDGTLSIKGATRTGRALGGTEIVQRVMGNGTIEFSSGGSAFFSAQSSSFEGTVRLVGNTRIYLGSNLDYNGSGTGKNTLNSVQNATIEVTSGSQVRITSTLYKQSTAHMSSYSDFIISGSGFAGSYATNSGVSDIYQLDRLTSGALAIDLGSTVYGNVTLADDASISSSSFGSLGASNTKSGYGTKGHLGGTVRGQILGMLESDGTASDLTIAGNESMTFTADSANTFGDLFISNGNGNNDDKFALRLNGGAARSQVSTALGTGNVTLKEGLILRLAGTGTANMADVVYTYANNISAGAGASLQSYNITNKLTGTVSMGGDTLNLTTASGGVLELAGGISGSGTLNVGASSVIILGSAAETLARSASPQFSGTIAAETGADITLASPAVVSDTTAFTGTDSLTLRFGGTDDYTLGGITMTASDGSTSVLTLNFDFSATPDADDANTWTTLVSSVTADKVQVSLDLNMFNDISSGEYTLVSGALTANEYVMVDDMDGRLSLDTSSGKLVLVVGGDNRLYWRTDGVSQDWNTTDANWYLEGINGYTAFSADKNVVIDRSGVGADNSASARETITLASDLTVGTLVAKDKNAYYEVNGEASLSGNKLAVGEKGDLKLSTTSASFTNGVQVDDASLEVSGTALAAEVSTTNGASFTLSNGATLNGNLDIADAKATINASTVNGTISASGTGSLSMTSAVLGSNSVKFENGTSLALTGATLSGNLSWQKDVDTVTAESLNIESGSVSSDAALEVESMNIASGSTLTVTGSQTSTLSAITGNGALLMADGNTATLNLGSATLASLNLLGGTTNISGVVTLADGARLSLGKATLNLNDGANVTTTHFRMGDQAKEHPSAVSINTGATLNITGSNNSDATTTSFLLAHWPDSVSSLVLNGGTLNAENTSMQMGWNSGANFSALAGEASLKGIRFSSARGCAETFYLGSATEGSARINIGSDGITGIGTNDTVSLGEGTLGATADYSISGNAVNLVATKNGTVFDTNGHTVTVNAALSGSGILVKDGAGVLSMAGNGTGFTGSINVKAGSLALGSGATLGALSGLSVSDGATLDVSGIDLNSRTALSLAAGATSSISSGALFSLGALEAETTYHIFDLSSGATLEGWDSNNLSAGNFTINGEAMRDMGRVEVALDAESGSFAYYINSCDLVWNGGASGTWNREESNTSWLQSFGGTTSEASTYFANNDSVSFLSDAVVTLVENVKVGSMTVANGAEVSLTETGALTAESIKVDKDATLTFATEKAGYASENISGEGKVVLDLTNSWNNVLKLGSSFTGETYVTSGYIDLTDATAGNTLRLAGGVNANSATGAATVTADLILEGTSIVHANGSKPITYEGTVTGENGVFESNGGSSHTFKAEVNLAGFKTSHVSNTNTFEAKTTLGTATISQATVTFTGKTDIAEAAISGGTTNFNDTATLASLTQTGGTINANGTVEVTGRVTGTGGTLALQSGELKLSYNKADGNAINLLDGSKGGNAAGTLRLAKNVGLTVAGEIRGRKASSIVLEQGAELVNTADKVKFSNRGTGEATFRTASEVNDAEYSTNSTDWELTNGHLASTASGDKTLTNKLVNSSVENAGSGKLTVSNSGNSITDVYATAGNIDIEQLNAAVNLNLSELTVAESKTVGLYSGSGDSRVEANVTVTSQAKFGTGAVLNANLTLASGSTLSVAEGGLAMGSTLTLQKGLTLDDTTLGRVHALSAGESTALFTGVDGLTLDKTTYTSLTESDSMLANPYFTNLNNSNQYVLTYSGTDNGTLSIMAASVPEPTTTTLSLLALSALAMRRRRK